MAPDPVDTIKLNVYAFCAQYDKFDYNHDPKKGDLQNKQVGNDFQKMFPACSYQGRTIQLNWKVESPDQFDTPPDTNKVNFYDLFLAIYDVGACIGRVSMDFLAKKCNPITATPYFKGKVIVVTPYNKKMLVSGRQDLPKDHVKFLADKEMFKIDFKNLDKIIPFVYRQDKLAEDALDKTHRWQFGNGQDVQEAIQTIVQGKLAQMARANKQDPVVNLEIKADNKIELENKEKEISKEIIDEPVVDAQAKDPKKIQQIKEFFEDMRIADEEEKQFNKMRGLGRLILSTIPILVAAVTAVASRILLPKIKEIQSVGLGFVAGLSSFLFIEYFRNRKVHA